MGLIRVKMDVQLDTSAMNRREYLKVSAAAVGTGALGVATNAMALQPSIDAITDGDQVSADGRIAIHLPKLAENGAVVPVRVQSNIPNTKKLAVLIDNHEVAHVATTEFLGEATSVFSLHIRMDVPCNVMALVHDGEKWFSNKEFVENVVHSCKHE